MSESENGGTGNGVPSSNNFENGGRLEVKREVIESDKDNDICDKKSNGFNRTVKTEGKEDSPRSPSPGYMQYEDADWEEEYRHYLKIASTFKKYRKFSYDKVEKTLGFIRSMPRHHQVLLKDYRKHIEDIKRCIDVNHNLFQLMMIDAACMFENHDKVYPQNLRRPPAEPTAFDYDKLQAVLKHLVRDWTASGQKERDTCYKPLIDEVELQYGHSRVEGYSPVKILIPGAGMGRLSHELVKLGYVVQGNEFSLFMLFASNFVLNKCAGKDMYKFHPWIHQNTNVFKHTDQTREVSFPDIDPCDLPAKSGSRFSMTAGDFLEVYTGAEHDNAWDCIVTCFFIDCANNIINYLERIFNCLKEGGTWLNLGPLLYHYSDLSDEDSIEPPFDLLMDIIEKIGFIVEKKNPQVPTIYAENDRSMLAYTYQSIFLVCRKPAVKEQTSIVA